MSFLDNIFSKPNHNDSYETLEISSDTKEDTSQIHFDEDLYSIQKELSELESIRLRTGKELLPEQEARKFELLQKLEELEN